MPGSVPHVRKPRAAWLVAATLAGAVSGADLRTRQELERVAEARAQAIAGLPERRRLSYGRPIEADLDAAGVTYERARAHLRLDRGMRGPAPARDPGPRWDARGRGVAWAGDGTRVTVDLYVQDPVPERVPRDARGEVDLDLLARELHRATDRVRLERGLDPLVWNEALARVALDHSRAMSRLDFFEHRDPRGREPRDRVDEAGIAWGRLGENLHKSRGSKDPVATAVESWMGSPKHRKILLTSTFRETGLGVARRPDGTYFMTQLFLRAPD